MATPVKSAILCVLFFCFAALVESQCDIPSRFWCDDKATAARCGVLDQCSQYEWREDGDKVELALYYECLCPDCQRTWARQLLPHYANLSSIMNLTLVPYGNAQETKVVDKWHYTCQHGPLECAGNLIETCTIALVKDINKYFPFIGCMEQALTVPETQPDEAAKQCAGKFPVPLADIMECTKSDLGNKLQHEMAVKTDALKPSHTYVPWFTLNGVHTEKIQNEADNNLVKLICDTYKGPNKPSVCKS